MLLSPTVPVTNMQVSTTDAGTEYPNKGLTGTYLWVGDLGQLETRMRSSLHQCSHEWPE